MDLVESLSELLLRVLEARGKPVFHTPYLLAAHGPRYIIEYHGQVAQSENDPQDDTRFVDPDVVAVEVS